MNATKRFDKFLKKAGLTEEEREEYKNALSQRTKEKIEEMLKKEERPKGKWISVKERLPEERVAVLIWCPERKNIYCACSEEKQWWIFGAGWEKVTLDVTAWMPLPEPYKGENESEECRGCHYNDGEPHAKCVLCTKRTINIALIVVQRWKVRIRNDSKPLNRNVNKIKSKNRNNCMDKRMRL